MGLKKQEGTASRQQRPTITVSMKTYNDEGLLEECLSSVREQDYPQDLVDILVVDGGSQDNTLKIAEKFNARILFHPELKDNPQKRIKIMFDEPKTDLILIFCADNRLAQKDVLRKMIDALDDQEIAGAETLRYGYRKTDPALSRYFALNGGADPVAVGLGKADRAPHDAHGWNLLGHAQDMGGYYKVRFEPDVPKIPTLGANGCIYRRRILQEIGTDGSDDHSGIWVRTIRAGHDKVAFVKEGEIIHFLNLKLIPFLKRRILYADIYSQGSITREYCVFTSRDWPRLLWILITYPTFVVPFLRSLKGYSSVQDTAWFLHPFMCMAFFASYSLFFIGQAAGQIKRRVFGR